MKNVCFLISWWRQRRKNEKCEAYEVKISELEINSKELTEKCNNLQTQISEHEEQVKTTSNNCVKYYYFGSKFFRYAKWFEPAKRSGRCTNFLHSGKSTILGKILNIFIKENLYFLQILDFLENDRNLCNACSKI